MVRVNSFIAIVVESDGMFRPSALFGPLQTCRSYLTAGNPSPYLITSIFVYI